MPNYGHLMRQHMHGKYPHMEMAIRDINNAILHYKDLKVKFEKFHYNNGDSKDLINLDGTIPVIYKSVLYNIPVVLWIQEQHPYQPPICFVQPTSTMQVRQGKHVDMNGCIYLPYLKSWHASTHSLIGCIQMMIAIFSKETPVFSKQPRVPQTQQNFQPMHRLPYPSYTPQGPPTTSYQPAMPPRAPYPMPGPSRTPYMPPLLPYPNYPTGQPTPNMPFPTPSPIGNKVDNQLDNNMVLASLRSAVNDKLKRRLRDTYSQAERELANFKKTENELKQGQAKVNTIVSTLNEEIANADSAAFSLKEKSEELIKEIKTLEQKHDELEPDDYVMATTPLYRQVVSSYAKEQALEDIIYHLSVAHHKEKLDLDTFLKHVRSLYREQFMLRATIEKARKTANLESNY